VKRGSQSFSILAPRFIKKQSEDEEEIEPVLAGFLAVPVFKVEDTEGAPLDYQNIELPELPLMDLAEEWNISVKAIPGNYRCSGYFSPDRKEIGLASKDESVFFHELAHVAHRKLIGELKKGQNWRQEIVAELAAATLCKIVGKNSRHLGNSYRYVERYAARANLAPWQACMKVISDTEKVLTLILDWKRPTLSRSTTREQSKELALEGRTTEPTIQLYN